MNETSSLSIGVDEELPSFSAAAPVPTLTRSLQDRYHFRPPGAPLPLGTVAPDNRLIGLALPLALGINTLLIGAGR